MNIHRCNPAAFFCPSPGNETYKGVESLLQEFVAMKKVPWLPRLHVSPEMPPETSFLHHEDHHQLTPFCCCLVPPLLQPLPSFPQISSLKYQQSIKFIV
jgi:hypothetical protein